MMELGQRIPHHLKIRQVPNGSRVEKWILRKAFEDLLPEEIVWRTKEQFDEGSGTADLLPGMGEHFMPRTMVQAYAARHRDDRLRSHEESVYHKLLSEAFADPSPVLENVARWAQ